MGSRSILAFALLMLATGPAHSQTVTTIPGMPVTSATNPEVPVGYGMYPGLWAFGATGSILRMAAFYNLSRLVASCSAEAYCVGFDTVGPYLRFAVSDLKLWTKSTTGSTYLKTGVVPGAYAPMQVPGYRFVSMKDAGPRFVCNANSTLVKTPYENGLVCSADPNCAGFAATKPALWSLIKPEACWDTVPFVWNQNDGMYIKDKYSLQLPKPAIFSGFDFTANKDSPGNNLATYTLNATFTQADVAALCAADSKCAGFNTNGVTKSAVLPTLQWTALSTSCDPDRGLYVKSAAVPSPSPPLSPPTTSLPLFQPSPEKIGIWVPFYTNADGAYHNLVKAVEGSECLKGSFKAAVLTGPDSGPPPLADAGYRKKFTLVANTSEWTTFGYLHTSYGKRPLQEVLDQIDVWLSPKGTGGYGDLVQGIWINQVTPAANTKELKAYFDAIIQRVRFYNGALVALNPGMDMSDCELAAKADFVNAFEGQYRTWGASSPKCTCASSTRCIASIYGYSGAGAVSDLTATTADAASRGFKATFITDQGMPNPYLELPTFWDKELQAVCKTVL